MKTLLHMAIGALLGFFLGILYVVDECQLSGKFSLQDTIVMCIVKDKSSSGTNLSWNR